MTYVLADRTARPHAVLDLPDQNFPLELSAQVPGVRELYRKAKRSQWNPSVDIDWARFEPQAYSDEQRAAARQYWSRRAWSEYGAIAESPALLLRFTRERRETDLALFWTIRTQEEVRHADVCRRMADALGGYLDAPVTKALESSVATHGVRGMSFDAATSLEALIAALICCAEVIAFDVFRALVRITRDPVARQVLQGIMRDEVRHCDFGWQYMEYRAPHLGRAELHEIRERVIWMMEEVELKGYHSAWLAPHPDMAEIEADRIVYEAGLGATTEEVERPVMIRSVADIRARMATWGIDLPMFHHPKLGSF